MKKHKTTNGIAPFMIAALSLSAFVWLAQYSMAYERKQTDRLAREVLAAMPSIAKVHLTLRERQARVYSYLYGIKPTDDLGIHW